MREARRRLAVELEDLAVGLRAELDAADVAHARDLAAVAGLDDDVAELLGIVEPARARSSVYWNDWSAGAGGVPIWPAATCSLCCCSACTTSWVVRPRALQLVGIEPDAHRVVAGAEHGDVADAGQAGELVLQPHACA